MTCVPVWFNPKFFPIELNATKDEMGVWISRLTKGRGMKDTPNISRDQSGVTHSPDRSKL